MKNTQENTSRMYKVVITKLSTTPAETMASMPGAEEIFSDFRKTAEKIREKNESLTTSRTYARQFKVSSKEQTVALALNLASCITAYALSIDDQQLAIDMKFTKSDFLRKKELDLVDEVQFILSTGITLLEDLTPFGINQLQIDQLTVSLTSFSNSIPEPRIVINNRKQVNREIVQLFVLCRVLLIRLDKLVDILKLTNNDFFTTYYDSRKIINYHGPKLAVRGFVLDSNAKPISSVQVSIPEIGLETKTTEKGYFEFKTLPAGIQNLNFNRVDYSKTNKQIGVIKGQRLNIEVTLENADTSQDVA